MPKEEHLGGGGSCWIRTVGSDACGTYLHTVPSCPNILGSPGVPKKYPLGAWAGKKPHCPQCLGGFQNRVVRRASKPESIEAS